MIDITYKTRAVNWRSSSALATIAAAVFLIAFSIVMEVFHIPIVWSVITALMGILLLSSIPALAFIRYHIKDDGLLITRPYFHKRLFKYEEILEVKKVSPEAAAVIVIEANRKAEDLKAKGSDSLMTEGEHMAKIIRASEWAALSRMYLSNPSIVSKTGYGLEVGAEKNGFSIMTRSAPKNIKTSFTNTLVTLSVRDQHDVFQILLEPENIDEFVSKLESRIKTTAPY